MSSAYISFGYPTTCLIRALFPVRGVRDQINTYMRTVMGEEPVDPTLEVLPDEESW